MDQGQATANRRTYHLIHETPRGQKATPGRIVGLTRVQGAIPGVTGRTRTRTRITTTRTPLGGLTGNIPGLLPVTAGPHIPTPKTKVKGGLRTSGGTVNQRGKPLAVLITRVWPIRTTCTPKPPEPPEGVGITPVAGQRPDKENTQKSRGWLLLH